MSRWVMVSITTLLGLLAGCSAPSAKRLHRTAGENAQIANDLIDRLTELSAFTVGLHPTTFVDQFLGRDDQGKFAGGIMHSTRPVTNDAMRELVLMGPEAIPSILDHLDDARPTRLEIRAEGHITWARATNAYNNRPWGVDVDYEVIEEPLDLPYTVKVGDVCLVILGQITDRPQIGVRYRPSGGVAINSPILYPEIVTAARADWRGVTRRELFRHFVADARAITSEGYDTVDLLARVKAYFPQRAARFAADLHRWTEAHEKRTRE